MSYSSMPSSMNRCVFARVIPTNTGSRCIAHDHPCTEVVFVHGGRGRLHDADRAWQYGHETVFAYQPGSMHWVRNEQGGDHLCLGLVGKDAAALPPGPLKCEKKSDLLKLFAQIVSLYPSANQERRIGLLTELLLLDLLEDNTTGAVIADTHREPPIHPIAAAARQIIDEQIAQPVTMSSLAQSLDISAEHLRRVFKAAFGLPPIEYLIRQRMQHARGLLSHTSLPVNRVCRRCGIDNPYYFSRLFTRVVGVSPSRYRAEHANGRG